MVLTSCGQMKTGSRLKFILFSWVESGRALWIGLQLDSTRLNWKCSELEKKLADQLGWVQSGCSPIQSARLTQLNSISWVELSRVGRSELGFIDDLDRNREKGSRLCGVAGYCWWQMFFEELKAKAKKTDSSSGNKIYTKRQTSATYIAHLLWTTHPHHKQALWLQNLGISFIATKSAEQYYLILWWLLLLLLH